MVDFHANEKGFEATDTVDDMIAKSGLGWDVKHVDCYIDWNGKRSSAGRKALVRDDNGHVLTVSGKGWKPVQNRDVVSFFHRVVNEAGARLTHLGEIRGGKGIWALADVGADFELKGGDKVTGHVLFSSYHEVGKATAAVTTNKRLWCQNQIVRATEGAIANNRGYRQNHLKHFDFDAAMAAIGAAKDEVVMFEREAQKLSKLKFSEEEAHKFLARQFVDDVSEEELDALIKNEDQQPLQLRQVLHSYVKAPGAAPGTGWGVLNAVTHWADHVAGTKASTRFDKAMFGVNAKLKNRVANELLELA